MEDRDLSSRVEGREEDTERPRFVSLCVSMTVHRKSEQPITPTSSCRESDDTLAVILLVIQSEI